MASNAATAVTDTSFDQQVLQSKMPVLVDFWAEWCMPCHMLSPIIDDLAQEYKGKVSFAKVNVDENPKLSQDYQILNIPMVALFKDGKMIRQFVGVQAKDTYVMAINELLGQK